jgi:mannose-1-phosphate guanylyltransferase
VTSRDFNLLESRAARAEACLAQLMKELNREAPMNADLNLSPQEDSADSADNLWAIVLAGGEGRRLAPVTRLLYGCDLPKQFAFLDGDRSLLQQTMERIRPLVPPHRTIVVVSKDRRQMAEVQLGRYRGVQIVSQPANAGTGPGVLLPLSLVKAQCPKAMVLVTPSDHHIPVPARFLSAARLAATTVQHAPSGLVVLGAEADQPDADLGWIVPDDPVVTSEVDLVGLFVEKPPAGVARALYRKGGLWNTMVVLGTVESFWRQAGRHMPAQIALFNRYVDELAKSDGHPGATADGLLTQLYRSMRRADFSRSVLQRARGTAVVKLKGSGWCDCGTPQRLLACLGEAIGRGRKQALKAALNSMIAVPT